MKNGVVRFDRPDDTEVALLRKPCGLFFEQAVSLRSADPPFSSSSPEGLGVLVAKAGCEEY